MRHLLATLLFLSSSLVFGQSNKFKWNTELCEYEGIYDTHKYSAFQLKNTYRLWFSEDFRIYTSATVWSYEDIPNLSLYSLDNEYLIKSQELKTLDIIQSDFWEAYKQRKIKDLDDYYKLSRITIQGYNYPSILKQYSIADSCIAKYADALVIGGNKLLETWRQLNVESRINNASPEAIKAKFNQQYNSTEKYKYAIVEIMNFGWWNCAIRYLDEPDTNDLKARENFDRLFIKIKTIMCDVP
jgi:hypothetical protein